MAKIIIDIPDRIQYGIEKGITRNGTEASQIVIDAVKNGISLPNEHGRLKDVDQILDKLQYMGYMDEEKSEIEDVIELLPTIVDADSEKR